MLYICSEIHFEVFLNGLSGKIVVTFTSLHPSCNEQVGGH